MRKRKIFSAGVRALWQPKQTIKARKIKYIWDLAEPGFFFALCIYVEITAGTGFLIIEVRRTAVGIFHLAKAL